MKARESDDEMDERCYYSIKKLTQSVSQNIVLKNGAQGLCLKLFHTLQQN